VSLFASLSPSARDELRSYVAEVVRAELAAHERAEAQREWLTTEGLAKMLAMTENAVRCRVRRGWLPPDDVVKDGKRLLIRKSAVLDDLDRRAGL
jgi:hypothetical protein